MNDSNTQLPPESAAVAEPMVETTQGPDVANPDAEYAVVEIFGHRRHVGRILEVERFGTKMLRVDVPTDGDFAKGFVSHFYGGASIFGLTPTDLDTVQRSNKPREGYGQYRLPAPSRTPGTDDDGELAEAPGPEDEESR